jgi:hypothetical protein
MFLGWELGVFVAQKPPKLPVSAFVALIPDIEAGVRAKDNVYQAEHNRGPAD